MSAPGVPYSFSYLYEGIPFPVALAQGYVWAQVDANFQALGKGSAWVSPTLLNSWANAGGSLATVQYSQDPDGMVNLKGSATGGLTATVMFVLPDGLRPTATRVFVALSNNALAFVTIDQSGNVTLFGSNSGNSSIDGIQFLGEV